MVKRFCHIVINENETFNSNLYLKTEINNRMLINLLLKRCLSTTRPSVPLHMKEFLDKRSSGQIFDRIFNSKVI